VQSTTIVINMHDGLNSAFFLFDVRKDAASEWVFDLKFRELALREYRRTSNIMIVCIFFIYLTALSNLSCGEPGVEFKVFSEYFVSTS